MQRLSLRTHGTTAAGGLCRPCSSPAGRTRQAIVCSAAGPRFFVGGNWKCNGTVSSVTELCKDLGKGDVPSEVEVVVAPSFVHLGLAKDLLGKTDKYQVAAQNCWFQGNGAYTGEISAEELVDFGITWVILGHSERRSLIHETNDLIGDKAKHALEAGLKVIACIGETLEERNSGQMYGILEGQLSAFLDKVSDWSKVVIAYEPVWAIGTGVVATPEQAQEVHAWLRNWFKRKLGAQIASSLRIIYGGSANDSNCNSLAGQADIDGFLVGGASLKGPAFVRIVQSGSLKTQPATAAAA